MNILLLSGNLQSLVIDYNVLACDQQLQVLAYFLPEAPAEMLKIFDEVKLYTSLFLKTDLCASLKQNKLKQECFQVYVLNNCFRLQKKLCYHCMGNTNGLQARFTSGFLIFLLWKKFVHSGALNFITGHTPVVSRKSNAHFMPIYVAMRAITRHLYLTPYVR